jgi:hypothetical protein
MMFKPVPIINKEYILNNVTEEDIFEEFLGITPQLGKYFINPLRKDSSPDCNFYVDRRGVLKFHDHATGWNWDCFNVVQHIYSCDFGQAVRTIAIRFNLEKGDIINPNKQVNKIREESKPVIIRPKKGNLDTTNAEYFLKLGFDLDTLVEGRVFIAEILFTNKGLGGDNYYEMYRWNPKDPCYVYHFGKYNYEYYFPYREKGSGRPRFMYSGNTKILKGSKLLPETGEILIITKSYKDVLRLREYGFYAVCPLSESAIITEEQVRKLQHRFTIIVSLFDFDYAGICAANRLRKLGITLCLFFTNGRFNTYNYGVKDFTEFVHLYGRNDTLDLIEQCLEYLENWKKLTPF